MDQENKPDAHMQRPCAIDQLLTADELQTLTAAVESIQAGSGYGEIRLEFRRRRMVQLSVTMTLKSKVRGVESRNLG